MDLEMMLSFPNICMFSNSLMTQVSSLDHLYVLWFSRFLWRDWSTKFSTLTITSVFMLPSGSGVLITFRRLVPVQLRSFINDFCPSIRFVLKIGGKKIKFLDLAISNENGKYEFETYRKLICTNVAIHDNFFRPLPHTIAAYNCMIHRVITIFDFFYVWRRIQNNKIWLEWIAFNSATTMTIVTLNENEGVKELDPIA